WSWLFGQKRVQNALVGLQAKSQNVTVELSTVVAGKHQVRCGFELDGNFGAFLRQPFARTQVKRHARPAPIVHRELERRKGGCGGLYWHVLLITVGTHLMPIDLPGAVLPQ